MLFYRKHCRAIEVWRRSQVHHVKTSFRALNMRSFAALCSGEGHMSVMIELEVQHHLIEHTSLMMHSLCNSALIVTGSSPLINLNIISAKAERIFDGSLESSGLDLDEDGGRMFLRVLLHLVMHDYPPLVSGSLQLLFRHFSQRQEVLQAFKNVSLMLT